MLKKMDTMKERWVVLGAICLVALCAGSQYAWSVFAAPMGQYLGAANLSIVFTVTNSVGPVTMISGGFINDRFGPRPILLAGGLLFGAGMIGSGFAGSVAALTICYGLGVGLGVGLVYGTIVSTAVKFFPDKSGLAGGLVTACYGGSSVLVPPIVTMMLGHWHITSVFKLLGAIMMAVICLSALVIHRCPADFMAQAMGPAKQQGGRDYNWRELLREPLFYLMLLTLTCGAFAGMMIISQASPIAQGMMGFTSAAAAGVVSLLALFNMLGRLASGSLSDKIGPTATLRTTFAASLVFSALLYFCGQGRNVLFYVGIAGVGFCFGSIMGVYPGFTSRQFGRKNSSVNYGIMFIGFALAGLIGPMIMNAVYSAAGQYQPAFLVSAGLAALGEVLLLVFVRAAKKTEG